MALAQSAGIASAECALGNDATMISALRGGTQEMTVPDSSTLVGLVKEFGEATTKEMLAELGKIRAKTE